MTRASKKTVFPAQRRPLPRTPVTRALHRAGSSPSEVARIEKVSPSHVTKVCKGESKSARIVARIEQITGKPWHKLVAEQS
jgi:hypothetical protein